MAQLLEHTLEARAAQVTEEKRVKEKKAAEEADASGGDSPSLVEARVAELRALANGGPAGGGQMPAEVREFMVSMREGGRAATTQELLAMMRGFKDNVTLDHLYRDQLVAMARFLGMNAFAPTALLRFQLRTRLKKLRNDDKDIMWEGVESLDEKELRTDLRQRGLPTKGLDEDAMREALRQWLTLSQTKDIPYALLILMNMLHFEQNRLEQTAPTPAPTPLVDADIDVVAAQAAISSLDESIARESTLVSSAEVTDDEKLESLWREEQLVEEENEVRQATVKAEDIGEVIERIEDAISQEKEEIARAVEATAPSWEKERLSREREEKKGRDKAAKQQAKAAKERREQEKAAKKKQQEQAAHDQAAHQDFAAAADAAAVDIMAADAEVEMSREQIRDIAEAVDIMAADSAVAAERKEMEVLEAERAQHRPQIEAAKEGSSTVAMLDRRVSSMLAKLQDELETADSSIGKAFHSLDLDGDGMLTRDELVSSMESLHLSKRPDAAAFQALLDQIDIDADGKISVEDFSRLVHELQLRKIS